MFFSFFRTGSSYPRRLAVLDDAEACPPRCNFHCRILPVVGNLKCTYFGNFTNEGGYLLWLPVKRIFQFVVHGLKSCWSTVRQYFRFVKVENMFI